MNQNQYGYNNQPGYPQYNGGYESQLDSTASAVMRQVYVKMCISLIISGIVAWFASTSEAYFQFLGNHGWAVWGLFIAEIVIVLFIGSAIEKLGNGAGLLLLGLFAAINGLALAPIFLVYTHESIAKTFFITAGTFGAMSVYGYTTSTDLTKFGKIMFMALIGLIIASVVNIFTKSSTFDWIISFAGVIIFVGLTAWDTQKIKNMAQMMPNTAHSALSTMGALTLYLDFINLFLYLLRFFGNSRR